MDGKPLPCHSADFIRLLYTFKNFKNIPKDYMSDLPTFFNITF